jgi:hypothetical protein
MFRSNILQDPALRQAISEIRQLIERFANNQSMDKIFDAVNSLNDDARQDEEFRQWFTHLNAYIRRVRMCEATRCRFSDGSP